MITEEISEKFAEGRRWRRGFCCARGDLGDRREAKGREGKGRGELMMV